MIISHIEHNGNMADPKPLVVSIVPPEEKLKVNILLAAKQPLHPGKTYKLKAVVEICSDAEATLDLEYQVYISFFVFNTKTIKIPK